MLIPSQYTCPHVSPYGQWLAYYAPSEGAVQLYRLSDGRNLMAPSQMGEPPVWSPHGEAVAMSDILFMGERTAVHLFRVDLESSGVTDISVAPDAGDENVAVVPNADGALDWSPDGRTLAIQRFPLDGLNVLPGLWLLDVATGHLRELVTPGTRPLWLP